MAVAVGSGTASATAYIFLLWLPRADPRGIVWPEATMLIVPPLMASLFVPSNWKVRAASAVLGAFVAGLAAMAMAVVTFNRLLGLTVVRP